MKNFSLPFCHDVIYPRFKQKFKIIKSDSRGKKISNPESRVLPLPPLLTLYFANKL